MIDFVDHTIIYLIRKGIVDEKDKNIYKYGLDVILSSVFMVLSLIIISGIVGNFFEMLAFFLAFIPLRVYAGGYHADTRKKCYISSIIMYILFSVLLVIIRPEWYQLLTFLIVVYVVAVVILFAPAIHPHHIVSNDENVRYGMISRIIVGVEIALVFFGYVLLGANRLLYAFVLGMFFEGILVFIKIMKQNSIL